MYDVAPDIELNRMAAAFVQFDLLDLSPGAGPIQAKLLKDSGLIEESADTILELKSIVAEYRNRAAGEEAASKKSAAIRRRARG